MYLCEEKADGSLDEDSLKEETLAFQIDYLGCKVSNTSKSLLEGLLTQDPEERLGQTLSGRSSSRSVRDITKHEFFESIKFSKLEDGEIESPFEPRVSQTRFIITSSIQLQNVRNVGEIEDDTGDGAPLCTRGCFNGFNWFPEEESSEGSDSD